MTSKQRIASVLSSWIEAHHLPGGYGSKARLPEPDESEKVGPWGYLKSCFTDGAVYFRFLQHPMFATTWMRAIADLAQERVFAMLPPGAVLASATTTEPTPESSEAAREAIAVGAVVAMRNDEDGQPEYLVLSPPNADAAVYAFGAKGHRRIADTVPGFVEAEVSAIRKRMPEGLRVSTKPRGEAIGWLYGTPPGLTEAEWPRHRQGGFPLAHAFTLELPQAYRVRKSADGRPYVAISFFHPGNAESVGFESPEGVAECFAGDGDAGDDPFLAAIVAHVEALAATGGDRFVHTFVDSLDHTHAVVFHTEESFRAPRATYPSEVGPNDTSEIFETLGEAAQPLFPAADDDRRVLSLGRPLHPMQGDEAVAAMGYHVLELSCDVGGANFGDGTAQYDLETGAFDWAC